MLFGNSDLDHMVIVGYSYLGMGSKRKRRDGNAMKFTVTDLKLLTKMLCSANTEEEIQLSKVR